MMTKQIQPLHSWALVVTPLVLLCSVIMLITSSPTDDDVHRECALAVDAAQQLQLREVVGTIGGVRGAPVDCSSAFSRSGFSVVSFGPNFSRPRIDGDYASVIVGYPVHFLGGHGDEWIAHKTGRRWKLLSKQPAWLS